ncbi:MAG: hypothetical protein OXB86_06660 [Bdellovibrionales bacterium]|nr:hypothetical protein [Bdellovibrionales bacterium]
MKHILLILAAMGLTACSTGIVKNESGESISVAGNELENGKCYEWSVFLGIFGSSEVAIKTTGDSPEQIGDKKAYEVGNYVVKSVAKDDASAVKQVDEAPQCTAPAETPEDVDAIKQAAIEAADAAIATADQKVQAANEEIAAANPNNPLATPETLAAAQTKKTKADAAKAKANEAKTEAEAAETADAAKAAKAKAEEAKAEAEAI